MLKALIFDMGGTLENVYHKTEFNEGCGKKLLAYLARHGIRLDFGLWNWSIILRLKINSVTKNRA